MPTEPGKTGNSGLESEIFLKPSTDLTSPSGFAAPPFIESDSQKSDRRALLKTASRVLQDPLLLNRLGDRVYELMLEDLRYQRERSRNYGSRFNV